MPGIDEAALLGPGAIAGVGAALGGLGSFFGGQSAARGQRRGIAEQRRQYNQTRSDLAPYREAGGFGLEQLTGLLQDPSSYLKDPSYQFQLDEGLRGLTQRAAAGGTLQSGNTLRDIVKFSGGLASTGYQQRVSNLQDLSTMGQNAAVQTGTFGQNTANQISGGYQGIGNAQAATGIGSGNAFSGGLRDYYAMSNPNAGKSY